MLHALEETDVHFTGLFRQYTGHHGDAGRLQFFQALAGHQRVGIGHRRHHLADAGLHQRVGAGRGAAKMAARFQGDVNGGAAHVVAALLRVVHGLDFSMVAAGRLGKAGADDTAIAHNDAADARVGRGGEHAAFGLLQCQRHRLLVVVDEEIVDGHG